MVELTIESIRVSLMNYQRVVILKEKMSDRYLPIWIGPAEADAIAVKLQGVAVPRPLTHDLLGSVLLAFGAKVERVIINHVEGSVFHARMILSASNELHQRKLIELDARPSDSIAMAVQQGAPLFVARKVWDTVEDVTDTLAEIEKRGLDQTDADDESSDDDEEDEDDLEDDDDDLDPDDLDLEALEGLNLEGDDEEDAKDEKEDGYDDGYTGMDDDDDEGEEWKKP